MIELYVLHSPSTQLGGAAAVTVRGIVAAGSVAPGVRGVGHTAGGVGVRVERGTRTYTMCRAGVGVVPAPVGVDVCIAASVVREGVEAGTAISGC